MSERKSCHHCEGKGYIEIRDCSGEIQREETCSFCDGLGYINREDKGQSDRPTKNPTTFMKATGFLINLFQALLIFWCLSCSKSKLDRLHEPNGVT